MHHRGGWGEGDFAPLGIFFVGKKVSQSPRPATGLEQGSY